MSNTTETKLIEIDRRPTEDETDVYELESQYPHCKLPYGFLPTNRQLSGLPAAKAARKRMILQVSFKNHNIITVTSPY